MSMFQRDREAMQMSGGSGLAFGLLDPAPVSKSHRRVRLNRLIHQRHLARREATVGLPVALHAGCGAEVRGRFWLDRSMLRADRRGPLGGAAATHRVTDHGRAVADLPAGWARNPTTLTIDGQQFRLCTIGPRARSVLSHQPDVGEHIAGEPITPGRWVIEVPHAAAPDTVYGLQRRRPWSRAFELTFGDVPVGTLWPAAPRGSGGLAELDQAGLDLPGQVFVLALLLPLWTPSNPCAY